MYLLYSSRYFSIHQCDSKRCFLFDAGHKTVWLSFCELLTLRQKVNAMDLPAHFDDLKNPSGIEILFFCNTEDVLLLNTHQVIDLKEFMTGVFAIVGESGYSIHQV